MISTGVGDRSWECLWLPARPGCCSLGLLGVGAGWEIGPKRFGGPNTNAGNGCGTTSIPKDTRVAILGGTCSRDPQGEGGIQRVASFTLSTHPEGHPGLSPSLELLCAAFCTGDRCVPHSTSTGIPSRDCPQCWQWHTGISLSLGVKQLRRKPWTVKWEGGM